MQVKIALNRSAGRVAYGAKCADTRSAEHAYVVWRVAGLRLVVQMGLNSATGVETLADALMVYLQSYNTQNPTSNGNKHSSVKTVLQILCEASVSNKAKVQQKHLGSCSVSMAWLVYMAQTWSFSKGAMGECAFMQ